MVTWPRGCGGFRQRHSSPVTLFATLQPVAVTVHLATIQVTLCSLYLQPRELLDEEELSELIGQLPRTFLLLGDVSAHHTLWGSVATYARGRMVERVLRSDTLYLEYGCNDTFLCGDGNILRH